MKYIKYLLFGIISFFISFHVLALDLNLQSENAILYHDNKVMYSKDENEKIQIASLTKIMTAIVTLDNINNLDEKITFISDDFKGLAEENLVTAGFKVGDSVTYKDLLAGLLLPSGAECAKALERLVSENFIDLMNKKAEDLNLKNTHFSNSIGLDDENNYSTAEDVYTMFNYALKNETFKEIITSKTYQTTNNFTFYSTALKSGNPYILGGKTGTTDGAGLCLASFAEINGEKFTLITAKSPYDKLGNHHLEDADYVYNYLANNYSTHTLINKDDTILSLKTKYLTKDKINFKAKEDITYFLPNNYNKDNIKLDYDGKKVLTYDLKKGDKLGTLTIYYNDELIKKLDITLDENLKFDFLKYLDNHKTEIIIIIAILILIILLTKRKKRRRKWVKTKK